MTASFLRSLSFDPAGSRASIKTSTDDCVARVTAPPRRVAATRASSYRHALDMPESSSKRSRRGTDVRRRHHQVGVRLLPEELEELQGLAERYGVSPAEVLRRALLAEARQFTPNAGPATG
ncbi:ribbon-helix-helix protein, CopG family [Nocardioides sp.]|uniref:ribbon-helix-helix protein, CopG family n=1 Tax=Nocardioides sp. TaxID=35761 RepID=UPI0039C9F48A